MLDFKNIKYNKEYLELAQAFIPDISSSDKDFVFEKDGDILRARLGYLEEKIILDSYFQNEKTDLKREIYRILKNFTGEDLAWGILVGVNPLKLVRNLLRENNPEKVRQILEEGYFLAQKKIDLALDLIKLQEPFVKKLEGKSHIYIDIPFCPSKCSYCSYPTYLVDDKKMDAYVDGLIEEIDTFFKLTKKKFTTVYIGGGTPSAIGVDRLERLIDNLKSHLGPIEEFTVEVGRPDTIDQDLLIMLKKKGVGRISINPQTMNDQTLTLIRRDHRAKDVEESFRLARSLGFSDINMDLIMGLPGEGPKDFKKSLEKLIELDPDSISIHSLALKKGSSLRKKGYNDSEDGDFETIREDLMEGTEFRPYYLYRQKHIYLNLENIGYAKAGSEGLYNIGMMEDLGPVVGFGLGASTKVIKGRKIQRFVNPRTLDDYLEKIQASTMKKIEILGSE